MTIKDFINGFPIEIQEVFDANATDFFKSDSHGYLLDSDGNINFTSLSKLTGKQIINNGDVKSHFYSLQASFLINKCDNNKGILYKFLNEIKKTHPSFENKIFQGINDIEYLKYIQIELANLITSEKLETVYLEDSYSINFVFCINNYHLIMPKMVAFELGGFICPKCNFELRDKLKDYVRIPLQTETKNKIIDLFARENLITKIS